MAHNQTVSELAARLLTAHGDQVVEMVPTLLQAVAQGQGIDDVSADGRWPVLVTELLREFFHCVAANDVARINAPGSVFEQVGRSAGRAGADADVLAAAIRLATRRTQAQVHRFVFAESEETDAEAVVVLERSSRSPEPTLPEGLEIFRDRTMGETRLWFLQLTAD